MIKWTALFCVLSWSVVSAFQQSFPSSPSAQATTSSSWNQVRAQDISQTTSTQLFGGFTSQTKVKKVDVYEDARRDVSGIEEWAMNYGVQKVDGVQLTDSSNQQDNTGILDVGIMTTTDIPANSPVLYVPNNMVLSALKAQQEFGQFEGAEQLLWRINEGEHIPQFYLMIKLLKEYENGNQSPYYTYLNSLPRYFASGAAMTHFCCTKCLPPLVGKLASKERIRFSKFFQALRQVPEDVLSHSVSRDRRIAKWAFAIVYTRSVQTYDGDVKIAPMADMFNHGTETEIQLNYDEEGNCHAYTTRDVPAGSQLRLSYGDPTNPSFLFARYGFLDESSPATFCKIMIDNPSQELINMGYEESRMLFYKDTGGVSPEVWDVLLYQLLGQYDPNLQQQFYQAHMNGDTQSKQQFHEQYYPQTSDALRQHIDNFLHELDVLMATAQQRMSGKKSWKHPRLPLIMRHNEFVRQTFLKVRDQL